MAHVPKTACRRISFARCIHYCPNSTCLLPEHLLTKNICIYPNTTCSKYARILNKIFYISVDIVNRLLSGRQARHEASHFSEASELAISQGSKWPMRKADHLLPTIVVVTNAWSYFSSTQGFHGAVLN